jgi:hypothetical protein
MVITVPGNKFTSLGTSFDNSCSFRELVPDTVYLYVEKWDWFAHDPIKILLLRSMFFRSENVQAPRPPRRAILFSPFGRDMQCRTAFITR